MKKTITALSVSALLLSGCAGREANPVAVIQANDSSKSCSELRQEISISQAQLTRLLGDQKKTANNNAAATAVGAVLFFPALFFLDLKGAAKEEAKAVQDRILGLASRHNNKGCRPAIVIEKPATEKGKKAVE